MTTRQSPLDSAHLPEGVRARIVANVNGLDMHVLEAGWDDADRPVLLLLHGFPELAFSWRAVMPALAEMGYRVIAPDQRGYGRTTGWSDDYDDDLRPFGMLNLVRDALSLLWALKIDHVAAVIGHDFGSNVAGWCALTRPDVFRRVVFMSAPYSGPPPIPSEAAQRAREREAAVHDELAALARPRKHYQRYYGTRPANQDMWHCKQGVRDFLRAYFHMKSADWQANAPVRLAGWCAEELARMPTYYIMDLDQDMAQTVAGDMPSADHIAANTWLPESAMDVYAQEYGRTGFQGGLNWYRSRTDKSFQAEAKLFSGLRINIPAMYVAGQSDWGIYQRPGDLEFLAGELCTDYRGSHLLPGAGHWVQQERAAEVVSCLEAFLRQSGAGA